MNVLAGVVQVARAKGVNFQQTKKAFDPRDGGIEKPVTLSIQDKFGTNRESQQQGRNER